LLLLLLLLLREKLNLFESKRVRCQSPIDLAARTHATAASAAIFAPLVEEEEEEEEEEDIEEVAGEDVGAGVQGSTQRKAAMASLCLFEDTQ